MAAPLKKNYKVPGRSPKLGSTGIKSSTAADEEQPVLNLVQRFVGLAGW